jgi:membrane protein DedA with SNARE-associated domain
VPAPATLRPVLLHASITNGLVTLATHVIHDLGYGGVLLLIMCSGVIAVPGTEPTLLFAGFNVYQHHLSLVGVIVFAVIGDVLGASVAYSIGYFGQRELLERHGGKLHLSKAKLDLTHRWFERWGAPTIFVSRIMPFVRFGFSYIGGVARMSLRRFIALTTAGSIVWMTTWAVVGREVGSQWQSWRHHLEYADYAFVALAVIAVVYGLYRWRRSVLAERSAARTVPAVGAESAEPDVGVRR